MPSAFVTGVSVTLALVSLWRGPACRRCAADQGRSSTITSDSTETGRRSDEGALHEGIVIRASSGQCLVAVGEELYACRVRGRLKQGPKRAQTIAVVGDRVQLRQLDTSDEGAEGVIERVLPRRNKISRRAARRSGGRIEQVLMANLDQVVAVQSVADPTPQSGFVDRLLVAAERYEVVGVLCLNKCDLIAPAELSAQWDYLAELGYRLVRTSALSGEGCADLHAILTGRISLLLGASGVGKSSLLNAIQPGLNLRVNAVTGKTGLGRHTTSGTELFPLVGGGFIADSPGLRGFDPWEIDPQELRDYFPDFTEASERCRFRSCLHREEPECGVKALVSAGSIPTWRHEAYQALLRDLEDRQRREGWRNAKRPGKRD